MISDYRLKPKERELILKSTEKLYDKIVKVKRWSDIIWAVTGNAKYVTKILENRNNNKYN